MNLNGHLNNFNLMFKPFPFFKQLDAMDCGPTCLRIVSKYHGKLISSVYLTEKARLTREGVSIFDLSFAAEEIGFKSAVVKADTDILFNHVPLPCIAFWRKRHFLVVYKVTKRHVFVADPAFGKIMYTIDEFKRGWIQNNVVSQEGTLLVLEVRSDFYKDDHLEKSGDNLQFVFNYIRPYKKFFFQLLLGLIIGSVFQLIIPFLTQGIVDYGILLNDISFVKLILIAQLVLFLSRSVVELIRDWIILHITSRMNINLISDFLFKLMGLPISFFAQRNIGDIFQRINDHERIKEFLSISTLNMLFSILNVLVFGAVLAYFSLKIFVIFLIGSVCYIAWTTLFLKRRSILDYKRFDQAALNQDSLFQIINSIVEIKLNGSERKRRRDWEGIQVKLFKISAEGLKLSQKQNEGGRFLNELQNIFITFSAATLVIAGEISLGTLVSIQYIVGQLTLPINTFVFFIQNMQDAKISLDRLKEIHNLEFEHSGKLVTTIPALKNILLESVFFKYGGIANSYVLNDLTFEIPEGKITAIVGKSGSGKSTIIKLLLGFYELEKGLIKVDNLNVNDINPKTWRRNCGVVSQDGYIFNDSLLNNICESEQSLEINYEKLRNAIRIANLEEVVNSLPNGINTRIGNQGIQLSGGQNQRVLIARAIYKDPEFFFLDEATSALDSSNEKEIMINLFNFFKGKSAVIVAHRLSTIKNADQIVVLDRGTVCEIGRHDELIKKRGAYFELVENQLNHLHSNE